MKQSNLHLHCGSHKVNREQVLEVPTPHRTNTWVPIPHSVLLDQVVNTLKGQGMNVVNEAHGLWKDGVRYFGLFQVTNGIQNEDYSLVVGVRNSHDKSFSAGLVLGASVFVCDNLSFSGEIKLARKHTVYIERDLPQLVNKAVEMLSGMRRTQDQRLSAYKRTELNEIQTHDLLVRAVDASVLPITKLPDVLKEWRYPSHPDFTEKTGWRLFNAFTEVLKGQLDTLPRRSLALHGLMDTACGLVFPKSEATSESELTVAV